MDPWICASLIFTAGALGGVVNALITDNGFVKPKVQSGIWCPGFIANVLVGAFAAFASWSFYGSGAGVELAAGAVGTERNCLIPIRLTERKDGDAGPEVRRPVYAAA
mgnify:CR=1 FL=1